MKEKIKILAISGSTRKASANGSLIQAIAKQSAEFFDFTLYEGIAELPHFNPDLDHDVVATEVADFRNQIREADGVLICTPEYALGVPGSLKNAIDWTVSSMAFSGKPVALITASVSGQKAHQSLLGTLLMIECKIAEATQIVIPFIKSKLSPEGNITDNKTAETLTELIQAFRELIETEDVSKLSSPLLISGGV